MLHMYLPLLLCLASSLVAAEDKRMLLDGSSQDLLANINRRLTFVEASLQECQCPLKSAPVVAFKAHLQTNMPNIGPNQHVVFEDVKLNLGNAYNKYHGTFTPPVNGTYLLAVTVCSHSGHYIYVDLMRNTEKLGQILAGDTVNTECSSETTVAELQAGDSVYIKHTRSAGDYLEGTIGYTSFSGTLLRAV